MPRSGPAPRYAPTSSATWVAATRASCSRAARVSPSRRRAGLSELAAWWATLPIVTQPAFYAVALPAVLLMGMAKSGFLGGFGSLAVPLMALAMPVPQAAAIMLPLLAVMDAAGLQRLWQQRDPALLRLLLPAGLLGTVVGTLL